MISLQGVSKSYRSLTGRPVLAVNDVTLDVAAGEVVGIAGPNGAGWRRAAASRRTCSGSSFGTLC